MSVTEQAVALSHDAIACNVCFERSALERAGIGMPQPFSVGAAYHRVASPYLT